MKKITCFCLSFFLVATMYAQPTNPGNQTSAQLLKQSKKEYARAWAFLGAGTALIVTGVAIGKDDGDNKGELFYETKEGWHYMLIGLGSIFTITSIPQFVTASKTKRKAELMMKNESTMITPKIKALNQFKVGIAVHL